MLDFTNLNYPEGQSNLIGLQFTTKPPKCSYPSNCI